MDNILTPAEYFDYVENRRHEVTDDMLQKVYNNCLELLNKYNTTGQISAMKKLMFHLDNIEKERELVKLGVNTFVYKSDIEDFIQNVQDRVVKVCDLCDYEREIPDEITEIVGKTKHLFTNMYVVYTDYTGETERRVEAEKRAKDPILFGSFQDRKNAVIVERFYFLGDWEDEYCDLTLDKVVAEVKERTGRDIEIHISTPEDLDDLRDQLSNLVKKDGNYIMVNQEKVIPVDSSPKKSFFSKIRTFFKK